MPELLQDVRFALRLLRKRPESTSVAVLTLALAIAASSVIYGVIHTVLLKPLPFGDSQKLVQIWEGRAERGWDRAGFTHANFWDMRRLNRSFEGIAAYRGDSVNLTGEGFPERLDAGRVSAGFFGLLRVTPTLGRTFASDEDQPGSDNRVALLNSTAWRRRFSADLAIVGKTLVLDGESYTVVGVLPDGEPWLDFAEVFVPLVEQPDADRVSFELAAIGRLADGASLETARADLESVARRLEQQYPEENSGISVDLAPSADWVASPQLRRALLVLGVAVGFLVLIACVNLANLLLARATDRLRETAVRAALGASRGRIVRQMLVESMVFGVLSAGLGVGLAEAGIRLIRAVDPGGIPRLGQVALDWRVLAFTLVLGLLTGVLSGLVPALQTPYSRLVSGLRAGGRGSLGVRGHRRVRSLLVTVEVALSLVLLVGAGLLVRSFNDLLGVDRGFGSERRLVLSLSMPGAYETEQRGAVRDAFLDRVRSIANVRSAAAVHMRPIEGGSTGMGIVPVGEHSFTEGNVPWASWRLVTADYFKTMGIPLIKGRVFNSQDEIGKPWQVVISQRLARQLWPDQDPLGRQASLWHGQDGNVAEVIGVVGDMRERGLDVDPTLAVYLPYYGAGWSPMHVIVHSAGDPEPLLPTLRGMLAEIDPAVPISNVTVMDEIVTESVATRRFNMLLLAIFAGVALLLALAGIYGVQAYSVICRRPEIGIRVVLGAGPWQVLGNVIRGGLTPAVVGIGLGLAGALALTRLMTGLLFGVTPGDPITYGMVAVLMLATALISCTLPALKALRIEAAEILRDH